MKTRNFELKPVIDKIRERNKQIEFKDATSAEDILEELNKVEIEK